MIKQFSLKKLCIGLVEVYYRLGLTDEAKKAAGILGYNYQSGEWYKKSYQVI